MNEYLHELKIKQFPRITKNITPFYCFDDCITTYAASKGIDFEMAYLDALMMWFNADKIDEGLGNNIMIEYDLNDSLNKYTSIMTNKYSDDYERCKQELVDKLHSGIAVCISILGYYCPWDWRYQEIKTGVHIFFITDYDETNDVFTCMDPYYEKVDVLLQGENVKCGFQSYRVFNKVNRENDKLILLKEVLKTIDEKEIIDSFNQLGQGIKKKFKVYQEIENYQEENDYTIDEIHEKMILNRKLKDIVHNYVRFSVLLSKYAKWYPIRQGEFEQVANEMLFIAEKWESIRFQLLKMLFVSNYQKVAVSICRRIEVLVNEIKELLKNITNIVDHKYEWNTIEKNEVWRLGTGTYEYLNLTSYFNHKGIKLSDSQQPDLNGIGEYIIGQTIKLEENHFKLSNLVDRYDNISCTQQLVKIDNIDYYTEALFLSCSEWGTSKDYITFIFNDDTYEKIPIELYDWIPNPMIQYENAGLVQCEKSICDKNEDNIVTEKCNIYVITQRLNAQKKIKAIKLPECENMHIFAITLKHRKE